MSDRKRGSVLDGGDSMRVYIVRHGKAVEGPTPHPDFPRPDGYPSDWDRPLVHRGVAQAQHLAHLLKDNERRIGFVLTSQYPRAIQTARLVNQGLGAELKARSELEVDHPVSEALRLIDEYQGARALMLVGHNPQLGELVSVLCAGLPAEQHVLKTGEAVVIDLRASSPVGSGRLVSRLRLSEEVDAVGVGSGAKPSPARARAQR
jgi:phosphohistidine phosphatase